MVMRITGLGQGPLADRRLLGERQRKDDDRPGEGPPRQAQDRVERRYGQSEQLRAEFAALNGAIQQTEDALAMATAAEEGMGRAAERLQALEGRLRPLADDGKAEVATKAQPDWLLETLAALEQIAETTCFGPLRLLDGSLGCAGVAVGDGLEFVGAAPGTRSSPPQGYEVMLSEEPVRATLLGGRAAGGTLPDGIRLLLREGGRRAGICTRSGQGMQQAAAALHTDAQRAGLALTVDTTKDGRLVVQHQLFGAAHRFAAASSLPAVLSTPEGGPRIVANGRDIAGTINGEPALGSGQTLTGCAGNPTTAGLVIRYTGLPYTGANGRLPRSRPAILEPRVFAGRVVVAQQALAFRLGADAADTIHLRLDSVRPQHLARGVATAGAYASLADARGRNPAEARDALRLVARARDEIAQRRAALHELVHGRLTGMLARLRVQSQNFAAASQDLLVPGAAIQAVQALSRHILREARSALTAQAHPPQGSLLELLGEPGQGPRGPRWN